MPVFDRRDLDQQRDVYRSAGGVAREHDVPAQETPAETATKRVEQLWQAADKTGEQVAKLPGLVWRNEWRAERDRLNEEHQKLTTKLAARAKDAEASEQSRDRYADAVKKVKAIEEGLKQAKEPRPHPPVRDEVKLEPSLKDRSLPPERLLAWVATLDARERRALTDRISKLGASREDTFAVALSNYFGDMNVRSAYPNLRARFLKVAQDPHHWVGIGQAAGSSVGNAAPASSSTPAQHTPMHPTPAQHIPMQTAAETTHAPAHRDPAIASPEPGIDKTGFIDNSKGALIYTAPAEVGGVLVRDEPLPPAARVFASGTHPKRKSWWYVTAFVHQTMVRGYVESFRINAELPEPLAELCQLDGGETPQKLAEAKFHEAVEDGHDLRFYENVLLYVNNGRKGISGTYQDPGILGNGSNNIKLTAGHRIWLVSPAYAKTLEGVVPSGSLTGGAVAKAKRFAAHVHDIVQSVTDSRHYFAEVGGEYAQAIRDHLGPIIGITAAFLTAEAGSMFLAAVPTGVSQIAAAVIQLGLSALGAAGMVTAGVEALKHASAWLSTAWTAHGKPELIAEASKEFLRMFVAIAIAALSYTGAKANYGNALKIANNMPTGGLPALATAGGGAGAGAGAGVAIGPGVGGPALVGAAATHLSDKDKAALGEGPEVDGMGERDVGEARARERGERRAADGKKASDAKQGHGPNDLSPVETRTEKAKHIPPPGEPFNDWLDSLTLDELDALLADESVNGQRGAAQIIAENIRHPGRYHEWLTVGELRQFKKWGVPMQVIKEGRTLTKATLGKSFRHGRTGSGTMHLELAAMVQSSNSYSEFLGKLNQWADRELVPSHSQRWPDTAPLGRYSLPNNLQLRGP